ncbi:MAG TPA: diguanylate cyclase, partial [Burkholderiaceae bacterium]
MADAHFQNLASDGGLQDTCVNDIEQDRGGYIWFLAGNELARWDGYRARGYPADQDDPGGPPPFVTAGPLVDAQGGVWVGSGGGVARRDPATERFDRWPLPEAVRDNVDIRALAQEAPDRYLVATTQGVFRLDDPSPGKPGRWSRLGGLPPQIVNSLVVDRDGRAWAGAHTGLYLQRRGSDRFERVPLPGPERPLAVLRPTGDELWVASDADVFVIDLRTLAAHEVPPLRASSTSLRRGLTAVVRVDQTHVWLGSDDGILVLDEATGKVSRIRHEPRRADSLPGDGVNTLFRDRSGLVWVGTNDGMATYDPSRRGVLTLSRAGNAVVLLGLGDGRVLTSQPTDAGGLRVLAPGWDAPRPFARHPKALHDAGEVTTLARLDDGDVLVGTDRALLRLDADGRLLSRNDRLKTIRSLRVDDGQVWIGTGQDGLWVTSEAHLDVLRRVDRAGPGEPFEVALIGPRIGRQRLVASFGALRLVDEATGALQPLQSETPADELPRYGISTLTQDARHRIWVATQGNGLYVLQPGAVPGRFHVRHFTTRSGLPGGAIDDVQFDAGGTAWLSTDSGSIVAMAPDTFATRILDRRDGATFTDFWAGVGTKTPDGTILFGSHLGIEAVHPSAASAWSEVPPTVVTSARVGEGARVGVVPAAGLTVPADSHKLAVEFSALDYSAPSYNRYRYRLDGVDGHWIDTDSTRRLAAYTNLPPGRYLLHLQGSNRAGGWGRELAIPVRVLPAWYQTWLARTLAGLVLLALATLVYALLTARLRRQRAALEQAVRERTHELRAANLQLERMSHTDALTGLHNRRYLTRRIDADVAAVLGRLEERSTDAGPAGACMSFFLVDLDHFKAVNDAHGHAAGDAVLREVAERLRSVAREADHLIRWGGEEFLLVTHDTPPAEAGALAERICEAMRARPFEAGAGVRLARTCSVGFAALPFFGAAPRAVGWSDVVEVADRALYQAKAAGRDGWVGLSPGPALAPDAKALLAAATAAEA